MAAEYRCDRAPHRAIPYIDNGARPSAFRRRSSYRGQRAHAVCGGAERRARAIVDRALRVLEPATGAERLPVFVLTNPAVALDPGAFVGRASASALRDDYDMIAGDVVPRELELRPVRRARRDHAGGLRLLFGSDSDLDQKVHARRCDSLAGRARSARVAAIDLRAPRHPSWSIAKRQKPSSVAS